MNTLYHGNMLEVLPTLEENSIDTCICDPPYLLGFMGKNWDKTDVSFNPQTWKEVLRVIKPGGYLLAFGGTRTYHRITCAIEDAGWEIKDCLMWLFGVGMPKGCSIKKQIDKIDRELSAKFEGYNTTLKPCFEPIVLAMKPIEGTYAENAKKWGLAGLSIDACRIATDEMITNHARTKDSAKSKGIYGDSCQQETHQTNGQKLGRWPGDLILDEYAAELLDQQTGILTSGSGAVKRTTGTGWQGNAFGKESRPIGTPNVEYGDSGGASRFFYCTKASRKERNQGLDKLINDHPTTKPIEIIEYLCKLTKTPSGDTVIDPFMGCYDDKTEILTKNGWKLFKDIEISKDEFITRDATGIIQYTSASKYHSYKYNGDMICIKSRSTDLLVTPNHNIYCKSHSEFCNNYLTDFKRADSLTLSLYRIPQAGIFQGKNNPLLTKEMMYLIGLYLSEGYFYKVRNKIIGVTICQNRGPKWNKMFEKLQLFKPAERDKRRFVIRLNQEQISFIKENCGESKYHKFIGPAILENEHLNELLEGLMIGDGNISNGQKQYYTASKQLADSFQHLCLLLGTEASVKIKSKRKIPAKIRNRIINASTNYVITIKKSKYKKIIPKKHITKQSYTGMVYCVTLNTHILYVRRNGKPSWCGNSGTTGIACANTGRSFIGIELDQHYFEIAKQRVAHAYNGANYDTR